MSNKNIHKRLVDELHDTYVRKNRDYGNSFSDQFEEYGLVSSAIRLDDKIKRFKQLINNEANVKDESIEDTLMDLANYSIMTVIELQNNRREVENSTIVDADGNVTNLSIEIDGLNEEKQELEYENSMLWKWVQQDQKPLTSQEEEELSKFIYLNTDKQHL